MKIRYYLRGLGLGILVTAIFFMVSGKQSQTMSDEMIKARAKELGMSESVVLSELPAQEEGKSLVEEESGTVEEAVQETEVIETQEEISTEESVETEVSEEVTEETASEEADEEKAEEEPVSKQEPEEESVSEEAVIEEPSRTTSNTEPIVVTVNRGEGSDTVSKHLQEAGLVADAHEYDRYLMANGYDKRIGAGEHSIPAGSTWEDIAKILCNMK